MRRIISVVAAMGLMAAMVVASAMPAFADKGGESGHDFGSYFGSCSSDPCAVGDTVLYGGKEAGKGGLSSYDAVLTLGEYPDGAGGYYLGGTTTSNSENERGGSGSKGGGSGGNCTTTNTYDTVYDESSGTYYSSPTGSTTSGNGSACK